MHRLGRHKVVTKMLGEHVVLADIPLLDAPVVDGFDVERMKPDTDVLILVLGEKAGAGIGKQGDDVSREDVERSCDVWGEDSELVLTVTVLVLWIVNRHHIPNYRQRSKQRY